MKTELFKVENIKCQGCASSIRTNLLCHTGVSSVDVDPAEGLVRVGFSRHTDRSAIAALLSKLGYPEEGNNTLLRKGKSYVSCAIGRLKSH